MPGLHLQHELFSNASFKPIDLDPWASTDFSGESVSPNTIFRYALNGDEEQCMTAASFLQRANPIEENRDEDMMLDVDTQNRHIISPFPIIADEREQSVGLSLHYRMEEAMDPCVLVDYSHFFDYQTMHANNVTAMLDDCDDFSISSQEASTISDDLGLESFSNNPASFWEDGLDFAPSTERSSSPAQISLGSSPETPNSQLRFGSPM
jgi:hypothetical protein